MQNKPRLSLDVYYSECIQIFHLYLGASSYKEKDLSLNINKFLIFFIQLISKESFNFSLKEDPWHSVVPCMNVPETSSQH